MMHTAIIIPLVVICRAILPLPVKLVYKLLLAALVVLAAFKFQIIHALGGPMFFAPDLPGWVLFTANIFYGTAFFYCVLLAVTGIFTAGYNIYHKLRRQPLPEKFRHYNNLANLLQLVLSVLLTATALYYGMCQPQVKEYTFYSAALPPAAENTRIAVLADLHIDALTRAPEIRAIVEKTNALKPDLTVILGDIVDGTVAQRGVDAAELNKLAAPLGVYAVPGNHEYFSGYTEWMEFFRKTPVKMLENSSVKLANGICIAGVTDAMARRRNLPMPDAKKALSNIDKKEFVLFLAHRPGEAAKAAPLGADLQLSGHTHGGMIRGFDLLVARFNDYLVAGWYKIGDMSLYISSGTAIWNGFPFRLGVKSEITVIKLKKTK